MAVAYASHGVAPRLGPRDPPHVGTVLLHRPGRTSLEREHQREGDGEQQYEEADWPQGKCELPSMGATVAECGRSLSAWLRTSAEGDGARVPHLGQATQLPADWCRFAEKSLLRPRGLDLREQPLQRRP